jgi:hypothetical protein
MRYKSLECHIFQKHKDYFKYYQRKKNKKKKKLREVESLPLNVILNSIEGKNKPGLSQLVLL